MAPPRQPFGSIFPGAAGGSISSATAQPAVGATVVTGQVPAGATATFKKNGTVLGAATVTAQGAASYTLGSPLVAGDMVSFPWTLTGESPAATVTAAPVQLSISGANGTANVGDTTSFTPTISGGTAPYTVTATGLPPGRSITNAATGLTTGAYTTAGSYSATYTVTDSAGQTASFTRFVTVSASSGGALGPTAATYATDAKPGTTVATFTGLGAGETVSSVSPNDGRVLVNAAGTGVLVGMSASSSGTTNFTFTTSTGRTLVLAATATAPATAAPATPTVVTTPLQSSFVADITDAAGSQPARRYGVYKATTSGGAYSFWAWLYPKKNNRIGQSADTTAYYKFTAENALGESAMGPEFAVTTATANLNKLRLGTTLFFDGVLWYTMIFGFQTGSTVALTSSDGVTIQTKTQNGAILAYGTFSGTGTKTITFVETLSGGGTNTSTQDVVVVAKPVSDPALFVATANAIKPFSDNPATYTDDPNLVATDTGTTMPAGYTAMRAANYQGNSMPYGVQFTAVGGNSVLNLFAGGVYDHVSRIARPMSSPQTGSAANTVFRVRVFKQTIVFGARPDAVIVTHIKARYSDDNMASWKEQVDPFFLQRGGDHYVKFDPGTVPGSGGRIWEIETSAGAAPADSASSFAFGVEVGDTPQVVADNSPVAMNYPDSFAYGEGSLDATKNGGRQAARTLGLRGFYNMGINSNRYTLPFGAGGTIALERIGGNGVGFGDIEIPPRVDVFFLTWTINDNANADATQVQAMMTNAMLKARYLRPGALIIVSVGFSSPQDRIPTANYNALAAAFNAAKDSGMYFNDGIASGWATAAGTTGSSPYWFASNFPTFTGNVVGNTLTVESISGATVEIGKYLYNGTTYLGVRVYKQLTGTPGGAGTYRLTATPLGGDIAGGTTLGLNSENYQTSYPTHPNPAGHIWMGQKLGAGAKTLVNQLATASGGGTTIPANALLDSSGQPILDSSGGYILAQ